jgi:hypothetical protein
MIVLLLRIGVVIWEKAQLPEQMRNLRARVVFDENTATELDDTIYDSSVQAQKILENGQLIIIRNGMRYDLQGKPL